MKTISYFILFCWIIPVSLTGQHTMNSWYEGRNLSHVTFPIGGIGAGMIGLDGNGAWSQMSITNKPDVFNEPFCFAAISVKGIENGAKLLQGEVPAWKIFGQPGTANGGDEHYYGLPRFENCRFLGQFPFGRIELTDSDLPLAVEITGWSPFIPGDADNSSLPVGAMEYTFRNLSNKRVEAVFSWNSKNIIVKNALNYILPSENGFTLFQDGDEKNPENKGWFTVTASEPAVVDHCWFRGGWWDALTMLWKDIKECRVAAEAPGSMNPPGASLFIPLTLEAGETKTVHLRFSWYFPESRLTSGSQPAPAGPAFDKKPAPGTAQGQQEVTGYAGRQLINTYYPSGDGLTGSLTSDIFKITKPYIAFLIGGGGITGKTCMNLVVGSDTLVSQTGENEELLKTVIWDVRELKGKKARIQIVDQETGGWGHINIDQIVFSDNPSCNPLKPGPKDLLFEDFEGNDFGLWTNEQGKTDCSNCDPATCEVERYYKPWYAGRFKSVEEVSEYWKQNYETLRAKTTLFSQSLFASTLPAEVMEAVSANLSILKSPTLLRDVDGNLWAWEGCSDQSGCCAGSCTHVWNYAQAIPNLFPELERSLRETEFTVSQNAAGHQTFRANLPINEPKHTFQAASDGQLGGIMKVYRDWRISGDKIWLSNLYPLVKQSIDYCILTWDPDHTGLLVEPHHNTYDIEFWGPDGMCSSFYLGALTAIIEMGEYLDKPVNEYRTILERGKKAIENELFNGEYFYQKIRWTDLHAADPTRQYSSGQQDEAFKLLVKEGPKYQYGKGCLSDGVLGMWMASVCGLNEIMDDDKVRSHLVSVYKYNLKHDLSDHDNPQRPTYALGKEGGLLLCTWPKGGQLSLPFVYSNEVWTGIEYQVASHLMLKGEVDEGLDIVRACRNRYAGDVRNPFDEYECGHWYARALSSYSLIQGLTGLRYDAVDRVLHIRSRVGNDFQAFIATEKGYGLAGLRDGKPFMDVKSGSIPVDRFLVE